MEEEGGKVRVMSPPQVNNRNTPLVLRNVLRRRRGKPSQRENELFSKLKSLKTAR